MKRLRRELVIARDPALLAAGTQHDAREGVLGSRRVPIEGQLSAGVEHAPTPIIAASVRRAVAEAGTGGLERRKQPRSVLPL